MEEYYTEAEDIASVYKKTISWQYNWFNQKKQDEKNKERVNIFLNNLDNIEKEREELKKMLGWPYTEVARINRFLYQWNFQRENKRNIKRFGYFCAEKLPIYFK